MSDWLKYTKLHHTWFDWSDPAVTADTVTTKLMGPCGYLKNLTPRQRVETEIGILRKARYERWGGSSSYKPLYQHLLTLMKLLMPRRDVTPNLADCCNLFCQCLSRNMKFLNQIGSQNSSKSTFIAMISMTCLAVNPEGTAAYVANPFDATADSTVWGEIMSVYNEIKDAHEWMWPKGRTYKNQTIEVVPGIPKAGSIEIRGVKDTGKFKGMKDIKDTEAGTLLIVAIDEVNEVKQQAFVKEVSNLVSQKMIGITSQNFTDESNMGGIFTKPHRLYEGNPNSFTDLKIDVDQKWYSHLRGVTIRFDGLLSPNILGKRVVYPYLFNEANHSFQLENYGDDSPEYYSQVRSFPRIGVSDTTVLSFSRRDSSRYKDEEWTIESEDGRASFLDPSFGGGDKAMWGSIHWGEAVTISGDSRQRERHPLVWFSDYMTQIPISLEAVVDEEWLHRCRAINLDVGQFILGDSISPEEQLAVRSRELNLLKGISSDNFGFDFSMRPEVTPTMRTIVGPGCIAFDYNTAPEGLWLQHCKKNANEQVTSRVGELAFITADLFIQRQVRGGKFVEAAITQLCRTRYELKGKKWAVESKRDFKKRHQGHSPDERDVLMGLVGMAYKRGFRPSTPETAAEGAGTFNRLPVNRFLTGNRFQRIRL